MQNTSEYEKVVELGKHLGFAVPASGLSLAQEEIQNSSKQKRRSTIDSNTPQRKKSRIYSETTPLNGTNKKKCVDCNQFFPTSGGWFTKHLKTCGQVETMEESTNEIEIEETKFDPEINASACPKCGKKSLNLCENCVSLHSLRLNLGLIEYSHPSLLIP